jgi:hypothetical protein
MGLETKQILVAELDPSRLERLRRVPPPTRKVPARPVAP